MAWSIVICIAACYLIGGLNGALLITKVIKHEDIRDKGSGNAGFTNAVRSYSKGVAAAVAVIDILKTVGACLLGIWLIGRVCGYEPDSLLFGCLLGGLSAQVGHVFPIFFGFRGGKGFVCALTTVAMTDWRVFLASLAVLFAVTLITKYISLASLTSTFVAAVLLCCVHPMQLGVIIPSVCLTALVFVMHRSNISRLINGTENKTVFFNKKQKQSEQDEAGHSAV